MWTSWVSRDCSIEDLYQSSPVVKINRPKIYCQSLKEEDYKFSITIILSPTKFCHIHLLTLLNQLSCLKSITVEYRIQDKKQVQVNTLSELAVLSFLVLSFFWPLFPSPITLCSFLSNQTYPFIVAQFN